MDRKLYLSNQAFENISQLDTLKPLFKTGAITFIASKGKEATTLIGAMIHNETANHNKRVAVVLCRGSKSEFISDFITPTGLPMAEMSNDEYNKGSICIIGDRGKSIHIERAKERLREFNPDMIFILNWDYMISDELLPRSIVKEFNVPIVLTGQMQLDYHDPFKKTDKFGLDIYDFDMLEMVDVFVVAHKPKDSYEYLIKTYKHRQKSLLAQIIEIKINSIPFVDFKDYLRRDIDILELSHINGSINLFLMICLQELNISHTDKMKKLDLSNNMMLKRLTMKYCDAEIDFGSIPTLKELTIISNPTIKVLDLSQNKELRSLRCESIYHLKELVVESLSNLEKLELCDLKIRRLNLAHHPQLKRLDIQRCDQITTLDLSKFYDLKSINYAGNRKLSRVIVKPNYQFQMQIGNYDNYEYYTSMNISDSDDDM